MSVWSAIVREVWSAHVIGTFKLDVVEAQHDDLLFRLRPCPLWPLDEGRYWTARLAGISMHDRPLIVDMAIRDLVEDVTGPNAFKRHA